MPEAAIPDVAMPDVAIPDLAMPDVAIPDLAIPDVAMPDVSEATPPVIGDISADRPPGPAAIERDEAWRRPTNAPMSARMGAATAGTQAPKVVDLAVPQPAPEVDEEKRKRSALPVLAGLVGLAILVGLAFLIIQVLGGSDDTEATAAEASPPSSEASAPVVEEEVDDTVSVFELRAGDCIVGDIGSGQVTEVTKVDCEIEHQFEVYREVLIDSSITTFDEPAISAYAEDVCRTSLEAYVPIDDERALMFKFLQPTEESWNQAEEPDRVITCLLFDDDAPLIGRAA